MKNKKYEVSVDATVSFTNHVDYCIGTGRMGLALQKEYQNQLSLVQEQIGFQYIRGHGIFCDDMAIYQEYIDESGEIKVEYNFTYLDRVMDSYQKLNIKPFLELGFMPNKLASGEQTVFYWKGNVTPPKNYDGWCQLVSALLHHLMERYGENEVVTWPIEVWNEPNLQVFWKDADMEAYFQLFQETFCTVKQIDKRFKVGGPAICGVDDVRWLRKFLEFCKKQSLHPDFVTRHHYTFSDPKTEGHYCYGELRDPKEAMKELDESRKIIDSFDGFRGMPMHITEFNTSYSPDSPVHDTTKNAAYIACLLAQMGDTSESYSYWTFGDVFEEKGVPFTLFHGGFGLVANGNIPKPTFWTFVFFKELQGRCIHRSDDTVMVQKEDGNYYGVAWNLSPADRESVSLKLDVRGVDDGAYCLITRTVDEHHGNPIKIWHDMGEPPYPSTEEIKTMKEGASPEIHTEKITGKQGRLQWNLTLSPASVMSYEIRRIKEYSDRGYDYHAF